MNIKRKDLTSTGLTIGREIVSRSGNTFIRLDSNGSDACVVVRDQKDGLFFPVKVYDRATADALMDRWSR